MLYYATLLLTLWSAGAAITPTWVAGSGNFANCALTTTVFGIPICVSSTASSETAKINHIANVFYQLLDNDADGVVDDAAVVNRMVTNVYVLVVPATETETPPAITGAGVEQTTTTTEAILNSCDVPTNRGATTDRTTWPAAINTQTGCSTGRDATVEEILHLITTAAATLYPATWGTTFSSTAGSLLSTANGNCGWGYLGTYINPSTGSCTGKYAYDDATCDEACVIIEGIYWAITTHIGGLYTTARQDSVQQEWLMCTPDASTTIAGSSAQATSLEAFAGALYLLVADTTSLDHLWIPSIMPNGDYTGPASTSSPSPSPSPAASPASSPAASPSPSPGLSSGVRLSGGFSAVVVPLLLVAFSLAMGHH